MKKIIFILSFLFYWSVSLSQIGIFTNPRSSSTITVGDSRLNVTLNLFIPRLSDTTFSGGLDTIGSLLYNRLKAKIYVRDTVLNKGHKWTPIWKSGDTLTSITLTNSDSTISAATTAWVKQQGYGTGTTINARRSITKGTPDSLQFVNDTTLNTATGRKFSYQLDTTGRRAYYEDKYVIGKKFNEIRQLRLPDTSYIFRANVGEVIGDYAYDPTDISTTDDTVVTIVNGSGYRYKRYIPDGVYDPHWWGAKANGVYDDTYAVEQALLAAAKYTGNNGTVIRLTGNYKFDPTNFVYPTGRGLVFEVTGNVQLLNTWRITRGVSIVGKGGATAEAAFAWSNIASIQYTVSNTGAPKAAIELTYGGNTLRNLTVGSYAGIGIKLNGAFFIPAALALLDNISVSVGVYTGKQIGLLVSDWFWFKLDNCSFSVDGSNTTPGCASIKLEGKTYFPDINLCYLGEFNNCTAQGKPIRIQAGDTADASLNVGIVNITFRNLTIENVSPDTAAVILNSTRIPIDNIIFERPVMVDTYNMISFIYNYGLNTSGVKIHDGDLLSGQLRKIFDGDLILNKQLSSTTKMTNNLVFNKYTRQLYDQMTLNGYVDEIDMNRGWSPALELQLYNGGQIAKSAKQLKDSVVASASIVSEPFTSYNGDTLAIKITPDGTNSNPTIQIEQYEKVWNSGDKIYFGAWVKSDFMDSILATSLKAQVDGGSIFKESNSGTITSDINYISTPNNGWRFLICVGTIDASHSDQTLHKLFMYVNSNDTNKLHPFYVSHPFAYRIDSASAVNDNEFISWVKMNDGGLYKVPAASYGLRNDLPIYIGDSSRFTNNGVLQRLSAGGVWNDISGGGSFSLSSIGSSPNANGASYSGGVFNLQPANGTFGGVLSNTTQTIAGGKTFTSQLTVSGNTPNNPTGLFGNMNIQSFNNTNGFVGNNVYFNNSGLGYTYSQTGEAAQFHFVSGDIIFETAPSGSGGTAATMTERMRVINTGNVTIPGSVAIGSSTAPSWPLDVSGVIRSKGGAASFLLNNRATDLASILLYSPSASDFRIYDFVNNTDRVEVDNTGQVGIATTPSAKLHVNGSVRFDLGSDATGDIFYRNSGGTLSRLGIGSSGNVLTVSGGIPSWSASVSATTIYTGDGTLSGNRRLFGNSHSITFDSIFNYRINSNSLILDQETTGFPYSATVLASSSHVFEIGYTPTPTVYSKGAGLFIDTNNNAGLAIPIPTTVPLYATGNSAYAQGFQSGGGNYYKVTAITGDVTITNQQYFFTVDATSGNVTITLPAASTVFGGGVGIQYVFKRIDASGNTVTIQRNGTPGTDTIDGASSFTIVGQYTVKELQALSTSTFGIK